MRNPTRREESLPVRSKTKGDFYGDDKESRNSRLVGRLCFRRFLIAIVLIAVVGGIYCLLPEFGSGETAFVDIDSPVDSISPLVTNTVIQTDKHFANETMLYKAKESNILLELAEEEWWEVEQTNDHIFNQFRTSSIYLRFADLDENGLHSCYEYKVVDNQLLDKITHYGTFCYPSIIVTGARKCSTSALVKHIGYSIIVVTHRFPLDIV